MEIQQNENRQNFYKDTSTSRSLILYRKRNINNTSITLNDSAREVRNEKVQSMTKFPCAFYSLSANDMIGKNS